MRLRWLLIVRWSCRRTPSPHGGDSPLGAANFTFPFGAHIVVTEVDRESGAIAIKRYVANSDLHASADYRRQMAAVYATRAFVSALARIA